MMETEKQENQLNEQRNAPAALADLAVTDEQAQQVAGGTEVISDVIVGTGVNGHVKVIDGTKPLGFNHNETVSADDEAQDTAAGTEPLADLPVSEEREAEVRGGGDSEWKYVNVRRMV